MATNVNERNVPDTPTNKMLDCLWEARNLSLYTVKICSNTNNFPPEYYQTMTGEMIKKAKDIYRLGKRANAIYVQGKTGHERWEERSRYQREAIFLCVDLLSDIDVAKTLFNIRGKRVKYWTKQVVTVKRMYIAWHNADKERYAKYINQYLLIITNTYGMQVDSQNVRLRSSNQGNACNTWNVNTSGNVNNNNASNANTFAPIVYQFKLYGQPQMLIRFDMCKQGTSSLLIRANNTAEYT